MLALIAIAALSVVSTLLSKPSDSLFAHDNAPEVSYEIIARGDSHASGFAALTAPASDTNAVPQPSRTAAAVSPRAPSPSTSCKVSYDVLIDSFDIKGVDFDSAKLGTNGSGLKTQIGGYGALTEWSFDDELDDPVYSWEVTGRLRIGNKACVQRAITSAGGPTGVSCGGSG